MSDELRRAFEAFMEAMDKELTDKDDHISAVEEYARHIEYENNKLKTNLKNAAGVLAAAAAELQNGLNDY